MMVLHGQKLQIYHCKLCSFGDWCTATRSISDASCWFNIPTCNCYATEEFTAPAVFNQQQEGQLFFNSTANAFKETILDFPGATWASGGNLNTARNAGTGTGITNTAALSIGGAQTTYHAETEQYDGSSWTEVGDLNTASLFYESWKWNIHCSLVAGGLSSPTRVALTESWNGSSWTETGDLNTAKITRRRASNGTTTSTIVFAGGVHPSCSQQLTETWDGSSWTEVGDFKHS